MALTIQARRKFSNKFQKAAVFLLNGFMAFVVCSKDGDESRGEALLRDLRRFVANSELGFYQIAARIGISGAILSMWLAGTASPDTLQFAAIERLLQD